MSRGTYGRTSGKDIALDARRLRPFLAAGGVDTYRVKVSADDTTPNFLEEKIVSADASVAISVTNDGADEDLDLSVAAYVAAEIATHATDDDAHHDPVTLAADVGAILGLAGQQLTLDSQSANLVFAGPSSGGAADPTFRSLVDADIPSNIARDSELHPALTLGGDTSPLFSIGAGQILTFDTQTANTVLAGPTSGGAADPTMRALVDADIPSDIARDSEVAAAISSHASDPDAHHNQSHVLATTSALGPDHTVSGLTARQVLIATGATTALFRALQSADLPTGSTLSVSSANSGTSHAITSSSAPGVAASLLATSASGGIVLSGVMDANRVRSNEGITVGSTSINAPSTGDVLFLGELVSRKSSTNYEVFGMRYLTSPATSTSWDGDTKTSADDGVLDLSTVFSIPAGVTAILVRLAARSSSVGDYVLLGPSSGAPDALAATVAVSGQYADNTGEVPCTSGDVHVTISGTCDVVITIWGYAI